MSHYFKAAVKIWRQADAEARAAEALLSAAWDLYNELGAPPVSLDLTHEVLELRARASTALAAAIREWELVSST